MSNHLPFDTLPRSVQERIRELLHKGPSQVTPEEFNFLRGRKDYLTSDQCKAFGLDKPAVIVQPETPTLAGELDGSFDRKAAKEKLRALGVKFNGNCKNEVLQELLAKHAGGDVE